jgi:hypothetical protein
MGGQRWRELLLSGSGPIDLSPLHLILNCLPEAEDQQSLNHVLVHGHAWFLSRVIHLALYTILIKSFIWMRKKIFPKRPS